MTEPRRLDAVGAVLVMLGKVRDPAERIRAIRSVRAELSRHDERLVDLLRDSILELRALDPPPTWAEIGELLDVTGQRAYQLVAARFEQTSTNPTPKEQP